MPRPVNLEKLQAQEQKAKDAKAALRQQQKALDAKLAAYERQAKQARLLALGQLVQDTFGTISMVEIAEVLLELHGGPVGIPAGGYSSLAPSEKTETRSESL